MNERSTKKHVTREEGERNSLDAVFPLVSRRIEREERFITFPRQDLMNALFVLMAGVESVPGVAGVYVSHRSTSLDHESDSSAA